MDRNTEAFLRRKKTGGIDRLAMRGPRRLRVCVQSSGSQRFRST
jgi:hypothetical protein